MTTTTIAAFGVPSAAHPVTILDIGDSIRVSDLKLPANVVAAIPVETVLATITGASAQADQDEAADTAAAEGAAAESAAEEGGEG